MARVDVLVTGEDAAEISQILKIPRIAPGTWGWRDVIPVAAELRVLRVRQLAAELGATVDVVQVPVGQGDSTV
ncbi:MAG: hypothetical protein R3F61_25190 [Myxococcota bacterium]